jgi:hypothetical protein
MGKLTKDWLTENYVDFELKQYLLLAYLQDVKENYRLNKIYPDLAELIDHYKNLFLLKKSQEEIKEHQHKDLTGFDFTNGKLTYSTSDEQHDLFETINQIVDFAMPLIAQNIQDGKTIYEWVEEHVSMKTIGISPLHKDAGYLLLQFSNEKDIYAYQYEMSQINYEDKKYRALHVKEVEQYQSSLSTSYENIKIDLIAKHKDLPNPAVYAFNCSVKVPLQETLLPIAKRYFVTRFNA